MTELDRLVAFVAGTRFDDLPGEVVARAKTTIMDTVGAILAGGQLPEVIALAELAGRSSGAHETTLIGKTAKADPAWACLYHGTAGTSFELDEGHAFSRGHPAIHTLPPALALGEASGRSGKDVLTAFILGYEVAARVGSGTHLRPGAHPHGTWGTLGAATAAALLASKSKKSLETDVGETIRVASNLTLAASFQAAYDGASVRNTYAGVGAQLGLLAAQLAHCGFTGERAGQWLCGQTFNSVQRCGSGRAGHKRPGSLRGRDSSQPASTGALPEDYRSRRPGSHGHAAPGPSGQSGNQAEVRERAGRNRGTPARRL